MATINTDHYLTTAQVAEELDCAVDTVKKYCQKGDLAGLKWGWSWMISRAELERFKKARKPVGRPKTKT